MNTEPNIPEYCDQMELVKKCIEVVLYYERRQGGALYVAYTIESVYLQFRKILELIAMASLIANKDVYSQQYANFARHWNARKMLKALEHLNPEFYPKPLTEENGGAELVDKEDGFLTRDDFVKLYKACRAILHTDNPYGEQTDYDDCLSQISRWRELITGLLNNHKIHPLNDPNIYVIHMQDARDNKVHGYTFGPMSPSEEQST